MPLELNQHVAPARTATHVSINTNNPGDNMDKFKNRYKAEDAVCEAFVTLGTLAGVDVFSGDGPADLDKDLIAACRESNYGDPHFLGGPGCFNHAKSLMHVERIFVPATDVSDRLLRYIERRGDASKIAAAKESVLVITSAHAWMTRVVPASRTGSPAL